MEDREGRTTNDIHLKVSIYSVNPRRYGLEFAYGLFWKELCLIRIRRRSGNLWCLSEIWSHLEMVVEVVHETT